MNAITKVFVLGAALAVSTSLAHADTLGVNPGVYGGTQEATTGKTIAGTSVSYTDAVFADPNNPFCSGCLDFVLQINDLASSEQVTSVSTTGFSGYSLGYAYDLASANDIPPTDVTTNKAGKVTFDVSLFNEDSDPLIIYTNALGYTTGSLTVKDVGVDPPAYAPTGAPYSAVTPEPSGFILLGTGLFLVAGALRRRLPGAVLQ